MQQVSSRWWDVWRGGGVRVREAWLRQGLTGEWVQVPVWDWQITASVGEGVCARYAGSVTLAPEAADLVDEQRTYIQVRAGFVVGQAAVTVPIATMFVDTVSERRDMVEVSGYSDEERVRRAAFRTPAVFTSGSAIETLRGLLTVVTNTIDVYVPDVTVPSTTYDRERWAAVQHYMVALDATCHVAANGGWRLTPAPSLDSAATVRFGPGEARIDRSQERTRTGIYNVVVVTGQRPEGETEGDTPYGVWEDANPASPTYVRGVFGESVRHESSPILTTNSACAKAAATYGRQSVGRRRTVTMAVRPLDVIEPGDTLLVERDGRWESLIADVITHRWDGAQEIRCREVRE